MHFAEKANVIGRMFTARDSFCYFVVQQIRVLPGGGGDAARLARSVLARKSLDSWKWHTTTAMGRTRWVHRTLEKWRRTTRFICILRCKYYSNCNLVSWKMYFLTSMSCPGCSLKCQKATEPGLLPCCLYDSMQFARCVVAHTCAFGPDDVLKLSKTIQIIRGILALSKTSFRR